MDVLGYLEQLLQAILANTNLPTWVVNFIVDMLKRYVTPDVIASVEKQIDCFICEKVQLLAGANPDPLTQQVVSGLNTLLNCSQCGQAASHAAPVAPAHHP